jgi:hypothetical protein
VVTNLRLKQLCATDGLKNRVTVLQPFPVVIDQPRQAACVNPRQPAERFSPATAFTARQKHKPEEILRGNGYCHLEAKIK